MSWNVTRLAQTVLVLNLVFLLFQQLNLVLNVLGAANILFL